MKILHTADLHIGKMLFNEPLLDQQDVVLKQLVGKIREERPDAVILAGDLFDQSRPSAEAIRLLDYYLCEIVNGLNTPVFAVSGNHDGAEFLNFGSSLMKGLHLVTRAEQMFTPAELSDEYGKIQIFMIPFLTPAEVRDFASNYIKDGEMPDIRSFDQAMEWICARIHQLKDLAARHIVVAHGFVTSIGELTPEQLTEAQAEGERLISIGGTECMDIRHLQDFHYVALGHLHGAHKVKHEHVRYSGSIYKYSKSEARQRKSITMVELLADGKTVIRLVPLLLQRDVREITLEPNEVTPSVRSEDYVFVTVNTDVITAELTTRVKAVFPNVMQIHRSSDLESAAQLSRHEPFQEGVGHLDHLKLFFRSNKEKELSPEQETLFISLWEQVNGGVRG